jgi:hypothetical protein
MSQVLDGYLIWRLAGRHDGRATASVSRHLDRRAVLDGHLIGGPGRFSGLGLKNAEAAP